ncbi:PII uridylyl-transferase [Candidatus Magnetomorum sp. HK-1]|nr:PII uridylyl-transferase [Candidatus Magnetomorum sp. HK-1]
MAYPVLLKYSNKIKTVFSQLMRKIKMKNQSTHKSYKDFSKLLKRERNEYIKLFSQGKPFNFELEYARLIDSFFLSSYSESKVGKQLIEKKHPFALLALGGYGRCEQCIHSDIDLLILFNKGIPEETKSLIKEVVYPLWDIGLDASPGTRTIKESIALASDDIEVLTAHMDARLICGSTALYSDFRRQLQDKIIRKKKNKLLIKLIEISKYRHERFGDSTYLLEPNLKEGQGGLRDYHSMLWMARLIKGINSPRDLEFMGCMSQNEYNKLQKALSFLWRIRNHLHIISARKNDQLHFEVQTQLASRLKYSTSSDLKPVESFLGELHGHMETIKKLHLIMVREFKPARRRFHFKRKATFVPLDDEILVDKDLLFFKSPASIIKRPELLMSIFVESARLKIPLSGEANRLVEEFRGLVDKDYRKNPKVIKDFEKILITNAPLFNVLNEMLSTGFLLSFIPEFEGIANRIQYDQYHVYPVDKHVLRTVQKLKSFGTNDEPESCSLCRELFRALKRKRRLLLWSALLHDIGKKDSQGNHSEKGYDIALKVLERIGYTPKQIDLVGFLVREHLLLIKMATRRDVDDEQTAIACARKIKTVEQLNMLYLLTVADSISTGPNAWSDWTHQLLKNLYYRTLSTIENGELATEQATQIIEKKKKAVLSIASESSQEAGIQNCFKHMSVRYLLYSSTNEMLCHFQLFESLGERKAVMHVSQEPETDTRLVTVCAKDRPGLFSIFTGILSINNISILDARVHTWRNSIALDIFKVSAPKDKIYENNLWKKIEKKLQEGLSEDLNVQQLLAEKIQYDTSRNNKEYAPAKIHVDNQMSAFYSIIEVFAEDRLGLLFGITDTLYRSGLNIYFAKIATNLDQVVDIFYVKDLNGNKIQSDTQIKQISQKISDVIYYKL